MMMMMIPCVSIINKLEFSSWCDCQAGTSFFYFIFFNLSFLFPFFVATEEIPFLERQTYPNQFYISICLWIDCLWFLSHWLVTDRPTKNEFSCFVSRSQFYQSSVLKANDNNISFLQQNSENLLERLTNINT